MTTHLAVRAAALDAAVAFTAAVLPGQGRLLMADIERAETMTLATAGRFEAWLCRPSDSTVTVKIPTGAGATAAEIAREVETTLRAAVERREQATAGSA